MKKTLVLTALLMATNSYGFWSRTSIKNLYSNIEIQKNFQLTSDSGQQIKLEKEEFHWPQIPYILPGVSHTNDQSLCGEIGNPGSISDPTDVMRFMSQLENFTLLSQILIRDSFELTEADSASLSSIPFCPPFKKLLIALNFNYSVEIGAYTPEPPKKLTKLKHIAFINKNHDSTKLRLVFDNNQTATLVLDKAYKLTKKGFLEDVDSLNVPASPMTQNISITGDSDFSVLETPASSQMIPCTATREVRVCRGGNCYTETRTYRGYRYSQTSAGSDYLTDHILELKNSSGEVLARINSLESEDLSVTNTTDCH